MSAPSSSHTQTAVPHVRPSVEATRERAEALATASSSKLALFAMVVGFALLLVGGITLYEARMAPVERCEFACDGAENTMFGSHFAGPAR